MLARISSSENSVCGCSIISDTFVLTAAHCTRGFTTFELGFGSIDFSNPSFSLTSHKKVEHSGYNPTNLNNDISLIELPVRLQWTTTVAPIQLPSYSDVSTTFMNRQATVSGFGKTRDANTQVSDRLMYVNVRVIGNSECSALYGTDIVRAFTLCSRGWDSNKQGTCQGDSGKVFMLSFRLKAHLNRILGGPLVMYDNNLGDNIQIGVVSFVSSRGCEAEDPAGFVRVTSYLDWIRQNTGIQIRP